MPTKRQVKKDFSVYLKWEYPGMLICLYDNWVSWVVVLVPVILPLPVHLHLRAQNTGLGQSSLGEQPKVHSHLLVASNYLLE